jgi:hypothetical protein
MSITDVYAQRGLAALLGLLFALLAWLVVQALRLPLRLLDRVLEAAQQRIDGAVVAGLPAPPAGDGGAGL